MRAATFGRNGRPRDNYAILISGSPRGGAGVSTMIEGAVGVGAVSIGTWFLLALRRIGWLSIRRPEFWFATGLFVLGVWFLWLCWYHST